MEKKEQFKEFVGKHPLLKFEVRDNKRTWQNIFEEWDLLGGEDESWKKYVEKKLFSFSQLANCKALTGSQSTSCLKYKFPHSEYG